MWALLPAVLAAAQEGPVVSEGPPSVREGTISEPPAAEASPPAAAPETAARAAELPPADSAVPAASPEPPKVSVDWRAVTHPNPGDKASILRGRKIYEDQGFCHVCHGEKGDGFGPARGQFAPFPNAFYAEEWWNANPDGVIMGVLHEGKKGTGMISIVPDYLSEKEAWDVINYLHTFRGRTSKNYERVLAEQAGAAEPAGDAGEAPAPE